MPTRQQIDFSLNSELRRKSRKKAKCGDCSSRNRIAEAPAGSSCRIPKLTSWWTTIGQLLPAAREFRRLCRADACVGLGRGKPRPYKACLVAAISRAVRQVEKTIAAITPD
jgi:hypothetical protein